MGAMNKKGGCDAHQKNATHVKEVGEIPSSLTALLLTGLLLNRAVEGAPLPYLCSAAASRSRRRPRSPANHAAEGPPFPCLRSAAAPPCLGPREMSRSRMACALGAEGNLAHPQPVSSAAAAACGSRRRHLLSHR